MTLQDDVKEIKKFLVIAAAPQNHQALSLQLCLAGIIDPTAVELLAEWQGRFAWILSYASDKARSPERGRTQMTLCPTWQCSLSWLHLHRLWSPLHPSQKTLKPGGLQPLEEVLWGRKWLIRKSLKQTFCVCMPVCVCARACVWCGWAMHLFACAYGMQKIASCDSSLGRSQHVFF